MKKRTIIAGALLGVISAVLFVVGRTIGLGDKLIFMIAGMIGVGLFLLLVDDKEETLLRLLGMCIPFRLGAMYTEVLKVDLVTIIDVFMFGLLFIWVYKTRFFQKGKIHFSKVGFWNVFLIFWMCLSVFSAISKFASVFGILFSIRAFLFFLYIINNFHNKRKLRLFCTWLLVGLNIQGLLGLSQKFLHTNLGFQHLGAQAYVWYSELSRASGTLGFPNPFGAYICLLLPLTIAFFIFDSRKSKSMKLWYGFIASTTSLSLIFSFSRSAWVGFLCSILLILVLMFIKRMISSKIIVMALIGLLLVGVIFFLMADKVEKRLETGGSGEYRILMINMALELIRENPIIGVGLHNYQYHTYARFHFWHPVHNIFLRLASETGIPGLILFLIVVAHIISQTYKVLKYKDKFLSAVAFGVIGGLTGFLIACQFGPQYQFYHFKFLFWTLAGIGVSLERIARREYLLKRKKIIEARAI